ncbi:hypothetical protein GFB49_12415 [Epibacterium sp. SM1979]|uniref:2-dehydro-3-deoxygalactonokinase n=1 Tax=Tritonibacter litoralis TaxID=2662264 RepID=A0A843YJ30_9RHOB|nr:2-dehydro-3-deoxygalactonokinase [Tritonibacter litoralis]MQQ09262.1 hypothetical protein [Tritonibacter litoralis]
MVSLAQSTQWIAVVRDGDTLSIWKMRDQQVEHTQRQVIGPTVTAEDLAGILSQTGWNAVPVVAAGLDDCEKVSVPTAPAQVPIRRSDFGETSVFTLAEISQTHPCGQLQGDATKIAGFLSLNPNWDGVICVVGNSSTWAQISADEVVSFETTLTPTLARSLGFTSPADTAVLTSALEDTLSRPEALAARLSSAVWSRKAHPNTADLSASQGWGALLGAELAATRPYWLGQNLALIAAADVSPIYEAAFQSQFLPVTLARPEKTCLAGLNAARRRILSTQI